MLYFNDLNKQYWKLVQGEKFEDKKFVYIFLEIKNFYTCDRNKTIL